MFQHTGSLRKLLTLLVVASAICLVGQSALAATFTWTDATDSGADYRLWSTAGDWLNGVIPGTTTASNNTDIALFDTAQMTGGITSTDWQVYGGFAAPYYLGGVQFSGSGAPANTTLTVGGGTGNFSPIYFSPGLTNILVDATSGATNETYAVGSSNTAAVVLKDTTNPSTAQTYTFTNNGTTASTVRPRSNVLFGDAAGGNLVLNGSNTSSTFTTDGRIVDAGNPGYSSLLPQSGATGPGNVIKDGTGRWIIAQASMLNIAGTVEVKNGVLALGGANAGVVMIRGPTGNALGHNATIQVDANGILDLSAGNGAGATSSIGGFAYTGQTLLLGGSSNNQGTTLTGSGTIANGVTWTGSAWTVGAYGAVACDGGIEASSNGGTHISPGVNGIGTLTTGNEFWVGNGNGTPSYRFDVTSVSGTGLQTAGVGADLLNIQGSLKIDSTTGGTNPVFTVQVDGGMTSPTAIAGWNPHASYSWDIATTTTGITLTGTGLGLTTTAFTTANGPTTGSGFALSIVGNNLVLSYTGDGLGGTTATTYNLTAAVTGSTNILKGASTAISANITNTGTGTADTLNFAGLNVNGTAVSPSSGGPLANNLGNATGTGTFTGSTFGDAILTPGVTSATNATIGGSATLGTTTTATVNVGVGKSLSTSFGTPLTGGVAASGSYAGLASMAGGDSNSVFTIARGTNTSVSPVTVSNAWRTAIAGPETAIGTGLVSDVVQTSGMNAGDTIVVEMSYDATKLAALHNGATPNANGSVYLAELISGNWTAAGSSWDGNQDLTNGGVLAGLTAGQFGVDLGQGVVWAAITGSNVNGTFAAVPEPGTIAMLISGLLALAGFAYRRKK